MSGRSTAIRRASDIPGSRARRTGPFRRCRRRSLDTQPCPPRRPHLRRRIGRRKPRRPRRPAPRRGLQAWRSPSSGSGSGRARCSGSCSPCSPRPSGARTQRRDSGRPCLSPRRPSGCGSCRISPRSGRASCPSSRFRPLRPRRCRSRPQRGRNPASRAPDRARNARKAGWRRRSWRAPRRGSGRS